MFQHPTLDRLLYNGSARPPERSPRRSFSTQAWVDRSATTTIETPASVRSSFQYPTLGQSLCNHNRHRTNPLRCGMFQYPSSGRWLCNRRDARTAPERTVSFSTLIRVDRCATSGDQAGEWTADRVSVPSFRSMLLQRRRMRSAREPTGTCFSTLARVNAFATGRPVWRTPTC